MMLEPNGAIKLLPSFHYDAADRAALRVWCHYNARYGLPTLELIGWLKGIIGERRAIEIGAGSGDLCYHLGIRGVDNHQQAWPDVIAYYQAMRQPTIKYGAWVERADALEAVVRYRPEIVIGSWITHWIDPNKPPPPGGGNMFGVKEDELIKRVETYIMIGNLTVHAHKPIMRLPHKELKLPFVKSRAANPEDDRIFIWSKDDL